MSEEVPGQAELDAARRRAAQFWKKRATTTFITNDAFYQRVDDALREIVIPLIGHPRRIVDIAAGSGRFTLAIAEQTKSEDVLAVDISEPFLNQLAADAKTQGLSQVRTQVADASRQIFPAEHFDLIVCMGLTTILVDVHVFRQFTARLATAVAPEGMLLMRDTLTTAAAHDYEIDRKRASTYWAKRKYMQRFLKLGFAPVVVVRLNNSIERGRENFMTLFRRQKDAADLDIDAIYAKFIDRSDDKGIEQTASR